MKHLLTILAFAIIFGTHSSAFSLPRAECVDSFHGTYHLYLTVDTCVKNRCVLHIFQHNSPSGCIPLEKDVEVINTTKNGLSIFQSDKFKLVVNTEKAPNQRLIKEFGRPFKLRRPIYRGQARTLDPSYFNVTEPGSCISELAAKYRGLVCTVK